MQANKKTLLWRFSGEKLPAPGYVFGTMHARSARVHQITAHIRPYIDACAAFAAEYDLDEPSAGVPFSLGTEVPLDQLMGPRHFAKARRILRKTTGIDLMSLRFVHPVLISGMLDEVFFSQEHVQPLDAVLWSYAKEKEKRCIGLESITEQWAVLQQISPQEGAQSIRQLSRNPGKHRRQMLRLMEWYLQGDPHTLYRYAKKGLGKYRRTFLYERNRIMTARILDFAQQQSLFAAVGAGHLSGEKGIIRLLKQNGCAVRPIPLSVFQPIVNT